jgi:hypothetical protein
MAFCCTSQRERPPGIGPEMGDRWKTRRLATAATEIANVAFAPGDKVVPHHGVPKARPSAYKSAGPAATTDPVSRMQAQDVSYFAELSKPSPVADAPPLHRRQHATPVSSLYSSPAPSIKGDHDEVMAAYKRAVESQHHDLVTCLCELENAIRSEDYERASRLKLKRDAIKARPLPPKPQPSQSAAEGVTGHALSAATASQPKYTASHTFDPRGSSSSASTVVQEEGGRTTSSGLEFLFSVWQHNPKHTPTPTNVHA